MGKQVYVWAALALLLTACSEQEPVEAWIAQNRVADASAPNAAESASQPLYYTVPDAPEAVVLPSHAFDARRLPAAFSDAPAPVAETAAVVASGEQANAVESASGVWTQQTRQADHALYYVGFLDGTQRRVALIEQRGRVHTLAVGERIGAFRVESVNGREVRLRSRNGSVQVLPLRASAASAQSGGQTHSDIQE